MDALLQGAQQAALLLTAQPPAPTAGGPARGSVTGDGGGRVSSGVNIRDGRNGGRGGRGGAGVGPVSHRSAITSLAPRIQSSEVGRGAGTREVRLMRDWLEDLETVGAELRQGEHVAAVAMRCWPAGNCNVDEGKSTATAMEAAGAGAGVGARGWSRQNSRATSPVTAAVTAAAVPATSATTAGDSHATAVFEPGNLKEVLDFFTKLQLEVAKAAPGMATLLPRVR